MMVAERDIPLADLRNKLLDTQHLRLRQVMYEEDEVNPLAHKHKVLLAKIKLAAMGEPLHCLPQCLALLQNLQYMTEIVGLHVDIVTIIRPGRSYCVLPAWYLAALGQKILQILL